MATDTSVLIYPCPNTHCLLNPYSIDSDNTWRKLRLNSFSPPPPTLLHKKFKIEHKVKHATVFYSLKGCDTRKKIRITDSEPEVAIMSIYAPMYITSTIPMK